MQFSKYYLEFMNTEKSPIFVAKEAQYDDADLTLDLFCLHYILFWAFVYIICIFQNTI